MTMPDSNTSALRRKMRDDDAGEEFRAEAEAKRRELVEEWLENATDQHLADLCGSVLWLRHCLRDTAKSVNLGVEGNKTRLIVDATMFFNSIRAEADNAYGDDLVKAEAQRLANVARGFE